MKGWRTPIKIVNGQVLAWVKMSKNEIQALPVFYRPKGLDSSQPWYCLGHPQKIKRTILNIPRRDGRNYVTCGEALVEPVRQ